MSEDQPETPEEWWDYAEELRRRLTMALPEGWIVTAKARSGSCPIYLTAQFRHPHHGWLGRGARVGPTDVAWAKLGPFTPFRPVGPAADCLTQLFQYEHARQVKEMGLRA